ncbi:MAG: tRNA 2-thiouridine(34) synthase MnmA [Oligoflexales bacterium]|nr:tRNA 2-thiouridine(34) synthase MnmA [Oligoflexales bacterium]
MSEIKEKNNKTVVVGMSGGVDSSVTALLLKQQGYRVIGLFMKNWEEQDDRGQCTSAQDFDDVALTCAHIGIPFRSVNFVKEYREQVFAHFLEEYQAGYTPNPDILCNREIKFNVFFKKAMELGADYLATGHYCRTQNGQLLKGLDPQKDQSYFLNAIDGSVLSRVLFPIGDLQKQEVRAIAAKHGLPTHAKKDSTGICFIGERHFTSFLSQYIAAKPGPFKRLDGSIVGEHSGVAYYTLGQRRQLGLGGPGERWYVVSKDCEANIVYVERGDEHPALYCDELTANEVSWINGPPSVFPFKCQAKVRYRQADQACELELLEGGRLRVRFHQAQRAIAIRQSIAFYDGERCLGGGMIEAAGPSYFDMGKAVH